MALRQPWTAGPSPLVSTIARCKLLAAPTQARGGATGPSPLVSTIARCELFAAPTQARGGKMKCPSRSSRSAQLKSVDAFRERLAELGLQLPIDDQILTAAAGSPLAQPLLIGPRIVGNRWCIHPMEGWDANADGTPSPHTLRRWRNFGLSGAKLIWGGEAAAVQAGRPSESASDAGDRVESRGLAALLARPARARIASVSARPTTCSSVCNSPTPAAIRKPEPGPLEPRIAYHHPLLDAKLRHRADGRRGRLDRRAISKS